MAIAADSLDEPLRGFTDLLTDLIHRSNFRAVFIVFGIYKMAKESQEADWMKEISNETVCGYFYYVFLITAVLAALVLFWELSVVARSPKAGIAGILRTLPTLVLAVVNTLFIYIICSRALLK
jgi:hypothetical protein